MYGQFFMHIFSKDQEVCLKLQELTSPAWHLAWLGQRFTMCHFMFNDTSLSGEHMDGERFFGSASQCSSTKPGEVESEYRCIHVEDFLDQIATKEASPGLGRRMNVLISSDGLIPDSSAFKMSMQEETTLLMVRWAFRTSENSHIIPWSLHSSCSSQNTTFYLAPPHSINICNCHEEFMHICLLFQQGIKGEGHCLLHHVPHISTLYSKSRPLPYTPLCLQFHNKYTVLSQTHRLLSPFSEQHIRLYTGLLAKNA